MNRLKKTVLITAVSTCIFMLPTQATDRVRIANEGGIRDEWKLGEGVKLSAPGYPAAYATRGDNVCAALGYRIRPDGTTGDFTLLKIWNSSTGDVEPERGYWDAFSVASAGALSKWRFEPRAEVTAPRAVDTVATMTFMGKQAEDLAGLRSRCAIPDLKAWLERTKVDLAKRGDLNRHQQEQNYRTTILNEARANQARRGGPGR